MDILGELIEMAGTAGGVTLSAALAQLPKYEQYLAVEKPDWRYDVGVKYGLLTAQLALALNGQDRDEVLSRLLELLAAREWGKNNGE
jgi:UTP--glucose-1-phosphate uridylyltransferase